MVVRIFILQTRQKRKKAKINPKYTDNKCFKYKATVTLNY